MNTRYQVLWDNRPSRIAGITKAAAAKAPKHLPDYDGPGELHSVSNGLYGYINFSAEHGREAKLWVQRLKKQGYLGVSFWDTLNNSLSKYFKLG